MSQVTRDSRNIVLQFDTPFSIPGYRSEYNTFDMKELIVSVNYADDDVTGRCEKAVVLDTLIMPILEKALKTALKKL